jgi:hypothetical protein
LAWNFSTVEGDVLQLAVDRQGQVAAVVRLALHADVLDDAAQAVLDHAAAARLAGQRLLLRQFHRFLAHVLDVGEADHVRHHLALRVKALVFLAGVEAVDVELLDLGDDVHVDLAFQVDVAALGVELLAQFGVRYLEQGRQFVQLLRRGVLDVFGKRRYRLHRQRRRQHQAVAVEDLAARGRQFLGTHVAAGALLLQELVVHRLHPHGAPGQRGKGREQHEQHHARAPVGQAHRQHRALGKGHALAGGDAGTVGAGLHLTPSVRYWVRAGLRGVMFNSVRAICSMRSFLPRVDWSSWSWAQSMSSWRCCEASFSMSLTRWLRW